jgi:hypothetical protein
MNTREKMLVRLLRKLPSRIDLFPRLPVIERLAGSIGWNVTVSVLLSMASLWISCTFDSPQAHCITASTIPPVVWIGAMLVFAAVFQSLPMVFRRSGCLRWTRNMMIVSAGNLLFALIRLSFRH